MSNVVWTTETRRLGDLKKWEKNANRMNQYEFERLGRSIREFGYVEEIVVNLDNTIIGGWHRYRQLLAAHGEKGTIEVRAPNRMLTEKEVDKLGLMLNQTGSLDKNVLLKNFEENELIQNGVFTREEIIMMDNTFDDFDNEDNNKGPKKKKIDTTGMKTISLEMLPEDYEKMVEVLSKVKINYTARSQKLDLGLKLGALIRRLGS